MPYPNEHAARINQPGKFKSIRRENNKFGQGIDVIFGILADGKAEVQAIRFNRKDFTVDQARAWLKKHDYKPIEFEPASGSSEGLVLPSPVEVLPNFGGPRIQAHVKDGKAQLRDYLGENVTVKYSLVSRDLSKRFENIVLEGEIKSGKLLVSQVLYMGHIDLHGATLEEERAVRTRIQDSGFVVFEDGVVVKNSLELHEALRDLGKLPGYESSTLKRLDSVYPLDGETSSWFEARKKWSIAAEIVQVHRLGESSSYNYLLAVRDASGGKVPLGKAFNVSRDRIIPVGTIVLAIFESLDQYIDPRTGSAWFNARNATVGPLVKTIIPQTVSKAREIVRESGGVSSGEKPYPGRFRLALDKSGEVGISCEYRNYLRENYPALVEMDDYDAALLEQGASEDDLSVARRNAVRAARDDDLYWDDHFTVEDVLAAEKALTARQGVSYDVSEAEGAEIPAGGISKGSTWAHTWGKDGSVRLDHRFRVNGGLNGWTIDDSPGSEEVAAAKVKLGIDPKAPVDTEEKAKALEDAVDWRLSPDKPENMALAFPKPGQPVSWLKISGLVKSGDQGGDEFGPGFALLVQDGDGKAFGVQKLYDHEYFEDGDRYKGRWIVRRLPSRKEYEGIGKEKLVWIAWFEKATKEAQIPYLLTRAGRLKRDWTPPPGVPGISSEYQEKIPAKFQWWGDKALESGERLDLIDQAYNWLADNDVDFPFRTIRVKESARTLKYSLTRTRLKGAQDVRGIRENSWSLFLYAGQGRLWRYDFDRNPVTLDRVVASLDNLPKPPPSGHLADWLDFEGELKPGAPGNPSSLLAASVKVLESGDVVDRGGPDNLLALDFGGTLFDGPVSLVQEGLGNSWALEPWGGK